MLAYFIKHCQATRRYKYQGSYLSPLGSPLSCSATVPLPSQRQNKHEVVELKTRLVQDPPRFRPKDICLFSFQLFKRSSARPELVLERETGAWNKFERITSKKVRMSNWNKLHRALVDLKSD